MYQFKNWKLICEEKDREIARLKEELERVKRVERLTNKDGKWIGCKLPDGEKCPPYELCECEHFHKMRNKLAEYESLEEQGLLLKLPLKKEDAFWEINRGTTPPSYYKRYAHSYQHCVYVLERLGKTCFLTKAEAEKALAEMEK